jgi:hypothetical protein
MTTDAFDARFAFVLLRRSMETNQGRREVWSDIDKPKQRGLQGQVESDDDAGEDA